MNLIQLFGSSISINPKMLGLLARVHLASNFNLPAVKSDGMQQVAIADALLRAAVKNGSLSAGLSERDSFLGEA